ncbi:MAG: hypothetical protein HQL88_07780 [Magnetococcales bacterium]|nr:hypothetical protein [Magnetococcales bacterium]
MTVIFYVGKTIRIITDAQSMWSRRRTTQQKVTIIYRTTKIKWISFFIDIFLQIYGEGDWQDRQVP